MTQAELAAAIGYDRSAIAKIEGGDTPPRRVVELAMRYLLEHKSAGVPFPLARRDAPFFRDEEGALGFNERLFGTIDAEIRLAQGKAIWFRLMPKFDTDSRWSVLDLRKAATQGGFPLVQLIDGWSSLGYLRGVDGFGVYPTSSDNQAPAVSYVFETGEVWSIDTYLIDAIRAREQPDVRNGISQLEDRFKNTLRSFAEVLSRLGLQPPFTWVAGIEGVKGLGIYYPPQTGRSFVTGGPSGQFLVDKIVEVGTYDKLDTPATALRPFFKKFFDQAGVERPDYLDDIGNPR